MIPDELKKLRQWAVSTGVDEVTEHGVTISGKAPRNPRTGQLAKVTDPSTWGTFEEAIASGYPLIGFILSKGDPYFAIDLDKPDDLAQSERQRKIYEHTAHTYAELSQSGFGVHILGRGAVPSGVRRDRIEVYSDARYIIMTGNTIRPASLADCQELLDILYREMSNGNGKYDYDLEDEEETLSDADVVEMASDAVNGEKFETLCRGDWEGVYPSQSEADYALINILAFYTRSTEQVMRLFRMSELGKRDKAWRDEYILRMLRKIRSQEPERIDFSALLNGNGAHAPATENGAAHPGRLANRIAHLDDPAISGPVTDLSPSLPPSPENRNGNGTEGHRRGTADSRSSSTAGVGARSSTQLASASAVSFPPGFVGEMAEYIYSSSSRPVAEIATAAALALTAGVVGRQYNISATGLNLYLIVLAKTGVGKEEAVRGIDRILTSVRTNIPVIDQFVGPGTFASGPAVIRTLDERPCFASVLGEFGLVLQALSDPNAPPHMTILRRVLLDVYGKSGYGNMLRSSAYADKEKNTKIVASPSLTLFGESTPETFYGGLNLSQIADGLIPRFSIIEYKGDRPDRNRSAYAPPPESLSERFAELVSTVLQMTANNAWANVALAPEAAVLMDEFDEFCDSHIRDGSHEGIRQLWNRAHLKALKLSGVLAVASNPANPVVTTVEAEWAVAFAKRDADAIASRFESGDIGEAESKQNADVLRVLKDYLARTPKELENYGVTPQMHKAKVVPAAYLQRRTVNLSAFRKHKGGARMALRDAITELLEADVLVEVPKRQMQDTFKTGQRAFWLKL